MMEAIVDRDPGDETDHKCEAHPEAILLLYDDGSIDSGPGEPYYDCPACRDEWEHPIIHCYFCNADKKTVSTMTVNERYDATEAYKLECGHTII